MSRGEEKEQNMLDEQAKCSFSKLMKAKVGKQDIKVAYVNKPPKQERGRKIRKL